MPLAVSFASIAVVLSSPATAEELGKDEITKNIPQLSDIESPATNASHLVQLPTQGNTVIITGVKANATEKGVEVILETNSINTSRQHPSTSAEYRLQSINGLHRG